MPDKSRALRALQDWLYASWRSLDEIFALGGATLSVASCASHTGSNGGAVSKIRSKLGENVGDSGESGVGGCGSSCSSLYSDY